MKPVLWLLFMFLFLSDFRMLASENFTNYADMTPESVDPQIVGNAFVQQYYNRLYESPVEVHKFYLEDSVLGRPGVSVKSLKDINDQIMSFDYQNSKIQILTADSQASLKNGVVTLVTGFVIGKDGAKTKFSQTFFLVPQKGSYFVLNDFFRYVSGEFVEPEEVEESPQVIESTEIVAAEPANEIIEAVTKTPENGHVKVPKENVVDGNSNLPKAAEAKPEEETPKRSFAKIVQSLAENGTPFHVQASPAKPKPIVKPSVAPETKAPTPIPEHPAAETIEQPGQGGSIFVANLPMDATPEQLYETFKGFGEIRKGGIQVRSYWEKKNCFGFVAFESREAIKSVLQAHKESPIRIGNRRASIEEKRGNSNVNGGRAIERNNGYYRKENGYRNDGYKPRNNGFNGGRGNGRNGAERQNGEATSDGKAYQKNSHGNAQARN